MGKRQTDQRNRSTRERETDTVIRRPSFTDPRHLAYTDSEIATSHLSPYARRCLGLPEFDRPTPPSPRQKRREQRA